MPDPTPRLAGPRLSTRGRIIRFVAIGIIVAGVIVTAMAAYVYTQAIGRFEVRRVSLPTRIFTDLQPLRAGEQISHDALIDKLQRLGYREAPQGVQAPGDYADGAEGVSIFLRPFRYPEADHPQASVVVRFRGSAIEAVSSPGGTPVEGALEPELLTSILSDQLENRRPVTLQQIPQVLVDAVVVTEDVRFWQHPGIDPLGILRAMFRNVKARGVAEGGSTLTQQLVKNYYLTNERTLRRKIVEAFMSVILDAKYSKREILEAYLNDIYLGRNRSISIIGVGEASRFYFGKPVGEIDPAQAALLAGMIRSPNNYSPFADPVRAKQRRDTVLGLLLRHRKIEQQQYDAALAEPLPAKPFRQRSGLSSIPFYVDRVLQEMNSDYGIKDVKGRGLAIYTAIDLDWQDQAAATLESSLQGLERSSRRLRRAANPLQGVVVAIDVPTGEIRALVGGRNYDRSQFNRVLSARRQVGSLFKPFVYLTAFEPSLSGQNITPATLVNDTRFVVARRFGKDWSPRNYNDDYRGIVTIRKALILSLNAASVRIGLSAGLDPIVKTAHALGVNTELDQVPSMILGAVAVTPIEMAESYTTIARLGSRVPLRAIRFVTTDNGKVVGSGEAVKGVQVFPARDTYLGVHIMEGVLNEGTAASARSLGFRKVAAGKTGTTNDKRDAWFIGFTPRTLALTWVGFDDNSPVGVSGAEGAVPMWARYMRQITAGQTDAEFPVPPGITFATIDENTGGLATPYCPPIVVATEAFKTGTAPSFPCPVHQAPAPPPPPEPLPPEMTDTITGGVPPLQGGFPTGTEAPPPETSTQPAPEPTATDTAPPPPPPPA